MSEQKPTILYIEDDPASRRLIERALSFAGYTILLAERGLQGLDLARRHHPDLILTDINLPDLSGQEIASTLRRDQSFSSTPIVALTAQGHGSLEWEMAFAAGINGYITKPIDIEAIAGQVEHYLKGGKDQFDAAKLPGAQEKFTQEVVSRLEKRIRDLEKANEDLVQLDKMKDSFIQITAHELRTPLTLVFGYTRLLEDNLQLQALILREPELEMLLEGLNESVARLQGLIEEIVVISRLMTNRIELSSSQVNIGGLLRKALRTYQKAINDRGLTIHFDAAQFPTELRGDHDLLYLVFANLTSNAIKYTPDGGEIFISGHFDAETLRMSLRDTGIGIDKAEQKLVFDRFHTTHNVMQHSTSKTAYMGGGLGLGLSISKGIIDAHGGQLWVESAGYDPQRRLGSTFHITLPMVLSNVGQKVVV
ncbi:MAG: hybrid sensor histidine kinase/response regulator [Armatimonadetes bacterium]|nr:hybrid sensor histidine kinase/response regulator [Anaerolineae bacterium]